MQLFELVSPRLFRPLAGPNRAFYAELLLLLWEECRHTADYSISHAEAVWRAEDYFAALAKPLALDADGAGDEEEQPTRDPHTLAVGFLLRLRRTGWLEEQPGSYEGEASLAFVPEVTPLLEALEEILNPRVVTYTGKLYKAWQLLGSIGQEKSPYENVLREVDADLDALNRSLRALNASIGHYIDRLTRNRTPQEVLGIPVVPISAAKNEGVDELVDHALHVAKYQERPGRMDFCSEDDHGGAVHRCIHGIIHLIDDHAKAAGIPVRFAATKLVEGDQRIEEALKLDQNEKEMIEHIIVQMEQERGLDRAAAIADMRFSFIQELVAKTVVKPHESKEQLRSNRIDKFLTGKYTAIPAFIPIMGLVFFLTFNVIGLFFQNLMETGIDALTGIVDTALTNWNVNAAVHSLLIDGIFTGVGSVLSFLPIIVVLFFFLSMLEDTGYMARVAFVMDKLLRRIGLSGRSIVPMLIGFGCTVPGVMASRTLPSERDRKMTILLTPFMSCSAKLPIYSLFAAAFFPQYAGLVMVLLYFTGIAVGVLAALLLKSTVFKGEAVPFVMELPNYRLPGLKNVAQLLWEKARDFLQKAFTVIFAATIVIWFLQNFDLQLRLTADPQASILARIAGDIAPLFGPLGFSDWRISTALITGFMAKESVVSSLLILFGSEAALSAALTPAQAAPLLVFCLLYTPCIAAVASVKRELGNKWAVIMVVNQCTVAWLCALLVRLAAVVLF